jgi:hypothetical protein
MERWVPLVSKWSRGVHFILWGFKVWTAFISRFTTRHQGSLSSITKRSLDSTLFLSIQD